MSKTVQKVLACGVFDLFHVGHLRYLQYAHSRGDYLIVGVSADAVSLTAKGKKPVITENQRLEIVRGLECVQYAAIYQESLEQTAAAVNWIEALGVDHVVGGGDWQGSERWNRLVPALQEKGISVEFAPRTVGISTTEIIRSLSHELMLERSG